MVIRTKSSVYKKFYELNGQTTMFGHDNLKFKTVNLPKTQKFKNICPKFNLKRIYSVKSISLPFISII